MFSPTIPSPSRYRSAAIFAEDRFQNESTISSSSLLDIFPRRDELFRISGTKNYPQFFLAERLGTTSFLGDVGIMKSLQEADALPHGVLDANPSLVTLQRATGGQRQLIALMTGLRINTDVVKRQEKAVAILAQAGIPYETVDGSVPEMKERREYLFKLSGRRGVYPQFFVYDNDVFGKEETVYFIGDFESFEAVNDASALPREVTSANPTIMTWEGMLGCRMMEEVFSPPVHS